MTGFFETGFFSLAELRRLVERSRQCEFTNLFIELKQHGFSQDFVGRFVHERLKLMQETKHSALLNYAQSHQHRQLAKEIIQSFLQSKPEAVAASMRENMTVRTTEVTPGKPKTIRL